MVSRCFTLFHGLMIPNDHRTFRGRYTTNQSWRGTSLIIIHDYPYEQWLTMKSCQTSHSVKKSLTWLNLGKRYLKSCQHHPILAPYFPMVPGSGFQADSLAAELQSSAGRARSRGGSGEGWKVSLIGNYFYKTKPTMGHYLVEFVQTIAVVVYLFPLSIPEHKHTHTYIYTHACKCCQMQ